MGFFDRKYICSQCGHRMKVIEDESTLWCPNCGYDVSFENYGTEYEDEFVKPPILEEPLDDDDY